MNLKHLAPFDLKVEKRPCDMDKREAFETFEEFVSGIPKHLEYIKNVLRSEGIQIDPLSSRNLSEAAEWIVKRAKMAWVRSEVYPRFRFAPFERDLSVPTKSACCYLGLMFGELMVEKVETASWILCRNDKREIYYNQPVVYVPGAKIGPLEPISVAMNYVYSRLDRSHPYHSRLFDELFDYWYKSFTLVEE
jgi:hypothetical protein